MPDKTYVLKQEKEREAISKEKEKKAKIKKFKAIFTKIDIENFIGIMAYGDANSIKFEPKYRDIVELNLEQNMRIFQNDAITYHNNLRATTEFRNGVYLNVIDNYKELKEFKKFLRSEEDVLVVLAAWLELVKILKRICQDFINEIFSSIDRIYDLEEYSEELKKLQYYIPQIKHNSVYVCLPVLPCYRNIQYHYFKDYEKEFKHWCINIGVTLFLKALLENPYNYKELYFKHIIGMTRTTSWDAKAYKIINKALYREQHLLRKYPEYSPITVNLDFISQLLIFDILQPLQSKILLNLKKNKSIVCVENVLSFV